MSQNFGLAEGVHECGATGARSTLENGEQGTRCTKERYKPTTMTVNWTPFLTLFPLRRPANDMVED